MNVVNSLVTGAHVTNACAATQSDLTPIRQLRVTAKFHMIHHHKIYKATKQTPYKNHESEFIFPDTGQGEA